MSKKKLKTISLDVLPDIFAERSRFEISTPQSIMGDAIAHLQGRQAEVYMLTMREGRSLQEVGEMLEISKSAAQIYQARAIKFITAFCKAAIERGEV